MSAAALLFSMNTYQRVLQLFCSWQTLNGFQKQVTLKFKKKALVDIVNQNYVQHSKEILMTIKRRCSCCLSGDGQGESPGHNTKYLTYSLTDKESDKIAAMPLIQVSEVDNSNTMGKKKDLLKLYRCSKMKISPLCRLRPTNILKMQVYERKRARYKPSVWCVAFCQKHKETGNKCGLTNK